MYCSYCGEALLHNETACPACGHGLSAAKPREVGAPEYARTTVENDLVTVAVDCYESLGWELTSSKSNAVQRSTALGFKRNRRVGSKAQLIKLQHRVDDLIATIADLEASKNGRACEAAMLLGIPSCLVMGAGMSLVMAFTGLAVPGIVLGVLGIAGCIAAWPLYRSTFAKESAKVAPQIERAYDELATVCEEGQTLLRGQVR